SLFLTSLMLGFPIIVEYLQTDLVPRLPTALLASGIMIMACLSLFSGLILDTVTRGRKEAKRLCYLQLPSVLDFSPKRSWSLQP
ncbi:MAG: glycosyl transferase, partial [Pseudorhizobium sp.]